MNYWSKVNATDGTEQKERFPEALRDDYFQVDEMSFEDLLASGLVAAADDCRFDTGSDTDRRAPGVKPSIGLEDGAGGAALQLAPQRGDRRHVSVEVDGQAECG
jgi:hypothetical protein